MGLFAYQYELSRTAATLERAEDTELKASEILVRLIEITNVNLSILLNKGIQGRTTTSTSFTDNITEFDNLIAEMKTLPLEEHERSEMVTQLEVLESYQKQFSKTLELDEIKNELHIEDVVSYSRRLARMKAQAETGLVKLHDLVDVARAHRADLRKQRTHQREQREQVQNFLLWALALDLVAGISIPLVFLLNTKGRLEKLIANANKLPDVNKFQGVSGSDEVAFLNSVLRDTSERLTKAEAERRLILDMVTHDIRSPLTSVNLLLESVGKERSPSVGFYQTQFQSINRIFTNLKRMVEDLLSLENLRSGAIELNFDVVKVRSLIDTCCLNAAPQLAEKSLTLVKEVIDADFVVDSARILQVLDNLLSNAIKHSPVGGQIDFLCTIDLNGTTISISDQGAGVPAGEESLVFERAYQAQTGNRNSGYGIGLAISKELVEKHGGKIWLKNNSSRGCTVSFSIPADDIP